MNTHPYSAVALRRSAWHFLSGKVVSGLLTFGILLWLVRLLPVAEYGVYVSLIAATELAYALGGLGLPWAAARFLPEARLHAQPVVLRGLVGRLLGWQTAILLCLAVLAGLTFDIVLPRLGLSVPTAAALAWAGLILVEGCGRFLHEGLLGPLMQQRSVRTSLILRQALFLSLLGLLTGMGALSLAAVLAAELLASLVAALFALAMLAKHLRALPAPAAESNWQAPAARDLWAVALPMYGGHLITLSYSPQVFLLLLQRFAGAEATAVFGFLRNLYEQAARYLPATLLFSLVRPKLVASYVGDGISELARNANLAGKLSLIVLMPLVGFAYAGGEALIGLLSGGKFPASGLLFFGFMVALIPFSQRQLLETVAVTVGRAGLCTIGAAMGLATLPLMLWLLKAGAGPWAGVAVLALGHLVFAVTVIKGLGAHGYRPDYAGLLRLGLAAGLAVLAVAYLPPMPSVAWNLGVQAIASVIVCGFAFLALDALAAPERQRINALLGRKLLPV